MYTKLLCVIFYFSATFPCVFCTTTKPGLKSDQDFNPRTVSQIADDAKKVHAAGATKKAKQENHSVTEEPFFMIPIDHVCIDYSP